MNFRSLAKRITLKCLISLRLHFPNNIGSAMGCAAIGVVLGFICAAMSIKAESGNMNIHVKRRIEAGERLLCYM